MNKAATASQSAQRSMCMWLTAGGMRRAPDHVGILFHTVQDDGKGGRSIVIHKGTFIYPHVFYVVV